MDDFHSSESLTNDSNQSLVTPHFWNKSTSRSPRQPASISTRICHTKKSWSKNLWQYRLHTAQSITSDLQDFQNARTKSYKPLFPAFSYLILLRRSAIQIPPYHRHKCVIVQNQTENITRSLAINWGHCQKNHPEWFWVNNFILAHNSDYWNGLRIHGSTVSPFLNRPQKDP